MKEKRKATSAVLATFRLSGDALKEVGITPLQQSIYKQSKYH